MTTTFFNQFTPAQLKVGYKNNLTSLLKCEKEAKKTGSYRGKSLEFWSTKVRQYKDIIDNLS